MGSALPPKQSYLEWPVERHCSRSASVFPACAGVVPSARVQRCCARGLPRIRGGGPAMQERENVLLVVFPAYAGVVPAPLAHQYCHCCLPRIRGGGPQEVDFWATVEASSPHTRGWSQLIQRHPSNGTVFPAYAGVVPQCTITLAPSRCLPRIRGGGPGGFAYGSLMSQSSPHTRGWSRCVGVTRMWGHVFPAYAGVVPFYRFPNEGE